MFAKFLLNALRSNILTWLMLFAFIMLILCHYSYITNWEIDEVNSRRYNREYSDVEFEINTTTCFKKSIVVTGMIKDGMPDILGLLLQIEKFVCHFEYFDIIIMENNSKDETLKLLKYWINTPIKCDDNYYHQLNKRYKSGSYLSFLFYFRKRLKTHKHLIHFDVDQDPAPSELNRMDKFVYYRNVQLEYVEKLLNTIQHSSKHYEKFMYDYLMIVDYDIQGIDQGKIYREFLYSSQQLKHNAFCVYGMEPNGRYRDSFATVFKDSNKNENDGLWCYYDQFECHKKLQQNRFNELRSCFGGLTIYSMKDIYKSQCKYFISKDLKQKAITTYKWFKKQKIHTICEHIAFHDCLFERIDNFTMVLSRDSYLYYGWSPYEGWNQEPILQSQSHY